MAEIEINPQFARALHAIAHSNEHLFITGKAGTGKSTLLQHYRDHAERTPVVLAPTGVAALEVGGETVHRFFGFGIDVTPEKILKSRRSPGEIYRSLDILIIDEASMLRADLLDCVDVFLRKHGPYPGRAFGGVRLIFVGDLYQLPPVVTSPEREIFRSIYDTPYFFSAHGLAGSSLEIIELEKVYRQRDDAFIHLLNRIRNNSVDETDLARLNQRVQADFEPPDDEFFVSLTTTNKNADRINEAKLKSLSGKEWVSTAEISGEFGREHFPTATELRFKEGAQIMLLNNDADERWVNGSMGAIEYVRARRDGEMSLEVRLRGESNLLKVETHRWDIIRFKLEEGQIASENIGSFTQLPLRLAWAVTIHKSQGKTFDRVIVDLERGAFASGQTYVALSRCTSFEGIVLRKPVKSSSIRADWRVQRFLTGYRYKEADQVMSVAEREAMIRSAIERGSDLEMVYLKPDDTQSERLVTPLDLGDMSYGNKQFLGLRAYCQMRREERTFRVDRILSLQIR